MKLKEILDKTTAFFRDKQIATPRLDAEILLAHGLKLDRIQLYLRFDQPMTEEELKVLRELVRRRAAGEPVAYIVGYRDFYAYRFQVNSSVLIPRPETEHVIEEVLTWVIDKGQELGIVDLGTGSGCIGLTLLKELPHARLLAVDASEKALEVAKANAQALDVMARTTFLHCDAADENAVMSVYKEFVGKSKIDILVSNPPYIAVDDQQVETHVKKFEPHAALYAEDNGLELLKNWSKIYSKHLGVKAIMLMEMGMTQGPAMKEHFEGLKTFNEVSVIKDLSGRDRVIRGVKNG